MRLGKVERRERRIRCTCRMMQAPINVSSAKNDLATIGGEIRERAREEND